jgi:hypothetical protein
LSSSGCCCQHLYTFWLLNFGAAVVVLSACSVAVTLFLCTIQLILDISTNVGTVFAAASAFAFAFFLSLFKSCWLLLFHADVVDE